MNYDTDDNENLHEIATDYLKDRCHDCGTGPGTRRKRFGCHANWQRRFLDGICAGVFYASRASESESAASYLANVDCRSYARCSEDVALSTKFSQVLNRACGVNESPTDFWEFWFENPSPPNYFVKGFIVGLVRALRENFWVEI